MTPTLRARGLCVRCGESKAAPKRKACHECIRVRRIKAAAYQAAHTEMYRASWAAGYRRRRKAGRCSRAGCGEPATKSLCERHLEIARAAWHARKEAARAA